VECLCAADTACPESLFHSLKAVYFVRDVASDSILTVSNLCALLLWQYSWIPVSFLRHWACWCLSKTYLLVLFEKCASLLCIWRFACKPWVGKNGSKLGLGVRATTCLQRELHIYQIEMWDFLSMSCKVVFRFHIHLWDCIEPSCSIWTLLVFELDPFVSFLFCVA